MMMIGIANGDSDDECMVGSILGHQHQSFPVGVFTGTSEGSGGDGN